VPRIDPRRALVTLFSKESIRAVFKSMVL